MGKKFSTTAVLLFVAMALGGVGFFAPVAPALAADLKPNPDVTNNPGIADLDQATIAKLTAENAQQVAQVIDLCESALRKGLAEDHAKIAKQLIVSTRLERATIFSSIIFEQRPLDQRWRQYRELAVTDLEKAREYAADHLEIHVLLGRLYSLPGIDGGRERAITAFNKAIELCGEDKTRKSEVLAYRAAAQSDAALRDADLNESIELDPKNLNAVRTRAMVRIDAREFDRAIGDLKTAIDLAPENARLQETLAVVFHALNRNKEAIEHLGHAIRLAPEGPSALAQRSRIFFLEDNFESALADSNEAMKLAPRNPAIQSLHAKNLQALGKIDEALKLVDKMLIVNPKLAQAIEMRASLLAEQGKFAEAITELKTAVEREPENLQFVGTLATLYAANKEAERAIAMYDRLLEAGLKIGAVYRSRADAFLSVGRQTEALADYQTALDLEPGDAGILNNLAWLMATSPDGELRNGGRAIELATEACQLTDYKKAYILSTLAAAHAEAGDFDQAIEWAEKAVTLSGDDVLDQLKAELESYRRNEPWRESQGSSEESASTEEESASPEATTESESETTPEPSVTETPKDTSTEDDINPPTDDETADVPQA